MNNQNVDCINQQYCLEVSKEISDTYNYFVPICTGIGFDIYRSAPITSPADLTLSRIFPPLVSDPHILYVWSMDITIPKSVDSDFYIKWQSFREIRSKIHKTFLEPDFRHHESDLPISMPRFTYGIRWYFRAIILKELCQFSLGELTEMFPVPVLSRFLSRFPHNQAGGSNAH